jgi:hypothetical protein
MKVDDILLSLFTGRLIGVNTDVVDYRRIVGSLGPMVAWNTRIKM